MNNARNLKALTLGLAVLEVIGLIVEAKNYAEVLDSGALGFLIFLIGMMLIFLGVFFMFTISGILTNLEQINNKLTSQTLDNVSSNKWSSSSSQKSDNISSNKHSSYLSGNETPITAVKIVDDKWFCPDCNEPNPKSSRVCKSCGYQR